MAPTKEGTLRGFGRVVGDLQSLLRSRASLTETEQLFLENRLLLLQCEYNLWTQRAINIIRHEGTGDIPDAATMGADEFVQTQRQAFFPKG